jgi:DNA (cytosine-5)-methyltransferase 1
VHTKRFYEFFAGVGLARVGLSPEWEPLWANDFDPKKANTYAANFGSDDFHLGDVTLASPDDLPGWAHMAWASFPCQDLSLAGWRRGMNGHRSGVFWSFWKLMRDLQERRPPLVVLENVVGLLHTPDFTGLVEALVDLDMRVGAVVMDAVKFLPQSRPRVFVIAVSRELNLDGYIQSDPGESSWLPRSVVRAHSALPDHLKKEWVWWSIPEANQIAHDIDAIMEEQPGGVEWHSEAETQRLLAMMTETNLAKVEAAQATGRRTYGFVYKRTRNGRQQAEVRFDGISGCLRTPSGGSSRQTVLVVEGQIIRSRLISPREMARLMGAPETFVLPEKYNHAYHAMGDAVVAPVVGWLAKYLLNPLIERYDITVGHFGWSVREAG